MRLPRPGRAALAALAFTASLGLVACSSDGSGGADVSDADVAAGLAYARAQLAMYESDPEFTLEAEPFPMKNIAGKTIFSIPTNSENPYNVAVDEESKKVAERYGATWIEYTNQGQPTQWATAALRSSTRRSGKRAATPTCSRTSEPPSPKPLGPVFSRLRADGLGGFGEGQGQRMPRGR